MSLNFKIKDKDIQKFEELNPKLKLDEARKEVIISLDAIDVNACPGSGKTTLIINKLMLMAEKWTYSDRGICILSHTNVAKNELIKKISESNSLKVKKLLEKPHFIGTIQEFINSFIALPYLRSDSKFSSFMNDSKYINKNSAFNGINKSSLYYNLKATLPNLSESEVLDKAMTVKYSDIHKNIIYNGINENTFLPSKKGDSKRYDMLSKIKDNIESQGIYYYYDMFIKANEILDKNSKLKEIVSTRFPFVIIDEMQDTQKHQDDILNKIFRFDGSKSIVQRYGDADQSIFNGSGSEEANETFYDEDFCNEKNIIKKTISNSFRFNNTISNRISGFSIGKNGLSTSADRLNDTDREASKNNDGIFQHSIILFKDNEKGKVIPKFIELIKNNFSEDYLKNNNMFRVVGGSGEKKDTESKLAIQSYYPKYAKNLNKKSLSFETMYDYYLYIQKVKPEKRDFYELSNLIDDMILSHFRLVNKKNNEEKYYNKSSLKHYLIDIDKFNIYNKMKRYFITKENIPEEKWNKIKELICYISDNRLNEDFAKYKKVGRLIKKESKNDLVSGNIKLYLSSIHSVKGETHDATLVLETKYYHDDISTLKEYLLNPSINTRPTGYGYTNMKKLYVAMSRPKHLLCLAMQESKLSPEEQSSLKTQGWKIESV